MAFIKKRKSWRRIICDIHGVVIHALKDGKGGETRCAFAVPGRTRRRWTTYIGIPKRCALCEDEETKGALYGRE